MKFQTSKLEGTPLLVAYERSQGNLMQVGKPEQEQFPVSDECAAGAWMVWKSGSCRCLRCTPPEYPELSEVLVKDRISLEIKHDGWWIAKQYNYNDEACYVVLGHSPMQAAMRCAVLIHLGHVVEIADELLEVLK